MKYCPKCGTKVGQNDKYCDHCGANLKNSSIRKLASNNHETNKNRKTRQNCLIIAVGTILLAAGGVVFFTLQTQSSNQASSSALISNKNRAKTTENVRYAHHRNISSKEAAAFTIAYAHIKFSDDPAWNNVFNNAENEGLTIASYPQYDFGNYEVKAPSAGTVYVLSPAVGYVVSEKTNPENARITFINSRKGASQAIEFQDLAKKVVHSAYKRDAQKISKKINL